MNIKLTAEKEFQMMQEFFLNGGTIENMPPELFRVRHIWKRADEILRKFPYYNNEKIANQLMADLSEYDLSLSTAKNHVTYAKQYFNFVESETPETHKRILTEICYKQIAILEKHQLVNPDRAHLASKSIELWSNRIASINGLYDKKEKIEAPKGDINIILSSDDMKFNDIPSLPEKELYSTIEEVTEIVDITESEKQKIISKDVENNIL